MLDAAGPWGTGPFQLTQGFSSIEAQIAIMERAPFAATWQIEKEERTPWVVLTAHQGYWNEGRGPHLEQVVFRNDLTREQALRLCMTTEGQVDLVTELLPEEAERVKGSEFAKLEAVDANRVLAGVFNRFQQDVPFDDRRVREALNLAVDREKLIREGFLGYAKPLPALTPPWYADFPVGLEPRPHDPQRARRLLEEAGWPQGRVLRLAAPVLFEKAARLLAADFEAVLGIGVEVTVMGAAQELKWMRLLAEKKLLPAWDVMLTRTQSLFTEGTPAFFHREFFGFDGALRAGPRLPDFDRLYAQLIREINPFRQREVAQAIDRYVFEEALGLFLCSPQALYAVNNHVHFRPYRTSLEFAETEVDEGHWSRRGK